MNDYTTITFPGLGISLNPPREIPVVGDFSIHFYGIIIGLGLLLAAIYGLRRSKSFGIKSDDVLDGVLWIVPLAVVCARLYYCIFSWADYKDNPIEMLYIWNGGLAIYGGVIGAALGVILFSKIKKVSLGAVLDLVAISFLIGQSIGRWGNFMNREAFGAETTSFLRMGLEDGLTGEVTYYHPTFLYESLWNAAGFFLLHFLSKKRKYDGQMALGYVAWYGLGRAFIEGLRTDSLYWGPFRVSQVLAAGSCLIAVALLIILQFRPHKELYVKKIAQNNED
jgi:phosphatidylglycerol:prolipoprotein diacylglycerol transferase